jgi:hypothetical protein
VNPEEEKPPSRPGTAGHKEHEGFRLENFIFVPSFVSVDRRSDVTFTFAVKILHCLPEIW